MVEHRMEYPIEMGIAYLFLAGYLARTLFVSLRLPASVGVIISGFCFSYAFQSDILYARDSLQELAFFLVLLTAGLEISLEDLKPHMFMLAWLPASLEIVGIATFCTWAKGFSAIEGVVTGTILVAIGDGLVIPKMKEFDSKFRGHPMPRLVFVWAPLEASFVLTVFGVLVGLARPANQPELDLRLLTAANLLRICATIVAGGLIGAITGHLVTNRREVKMRDVPFFLGTSVEAFLLVLAVALAAFGLGSQHDGVPLVPMGFSEGSMFQPELLVIVVGSSFAAATSPEDLHDVEGILGGVWVFGQLVLFSMLGSRTSLSVFTELPQVLPMMCAGLLFRFFGVFAACAATTEARQRSWDDLPFDAGFCFLSTLPRATIQGALGSVPMQKRFFQGDPDKVAAERFIGCSARLYIVCMSVFGMLLLDLVGPYFLENTRQSAEYGELEATSGSAELLEAGAVAQEQRARAEEQRAPPAAAEAPPPQRPQQRHHGKKGAVAVTEQDPETAVGAGFCAPPTLSDSILLAGLLDLRRRLFFNTDPARVPAGDRAASKANYHPRYSRRQLELTLSQFESSGSVWW